MKRRRERKPAPTCFVNTLSQLAGRPVPAPRPFPDGLPEGEVFYLRTEIGTPGYKLPAYETFPCGRMLHRGHPPGTILGPVLSLVSFSRYERHKGKTTGFLREFVAAVVPFGSDYDMDVCYVNIWTSHNNEGRKKGMKYATLFASNRRRDRGATPLTAPRHLFIETAADATAVRKLAGFDILRQRMFEFEGSARSADPTLEDDEESGGESQEEANAAAGESPELQKSQENRKG